MNRDIISIKHLIQLPVANFINTYHFRYVERYCFTTTVEYLNKYVYIATVKCNFIAKDGTGTMILLFFFLFYFVYGSSSSFKTLPKTIQGYFLLCLSNRFISFYEHSFPHILSKSIVSNCIKKLRNSKIIPLWKNKFTIDHRIIYKLSNLLTIVRVDK